MQASGVQASRSTATTSAECLVESRHRDARASTSGRLYRLKEEPWSASLSGTSTGTRRRASKIASVYPDGIHGAIAAGLEEAGGFKVRTATLDEPEHGLTEDVLANTDVLVWWGHKAHGDVDDEIVDRVQARVLDGMGLVVLHSGHLSKIFMKLMGTTCNLKWREADEKERIWVVEQGHPIAEGLGEYIELAQEEMYGEHFDIPAAGPADLRLLVRRRRGLPLRRHLPPRRRARSSTSAPATRPTRPTTTRKSGGSSPTASAGPPRSTARSGLTATGKPLEKI